VQQGVGTVVAATAVPWEAAKTDGPWAATAAVPVFAAAVPKIAFTKDKNRAETNIAILKKETFKLAFWPWAKMATVIKFFFRNN